MPYLNRKSSTQKEVPKPAVHVAFKRGYFTPSPRICSLNTCIYLLSAFCCLLSARFSVARYGASNFMPDLQHTLALLVARTTPLHRLVALPLVNGLNGVSSTPLPQFSPCRPRTVDGLFFPRFAIHLHCCCWLLQKHPFPRSWQSAVHPAPCLPPDDATQMLCRKMTYPM